MGGDSMREGHRQRSKLTMSQEPQFSLVTQSCSTLCNPMDCPWNSPGQNTAVGSLSLLQNG